jgi:serine-type D-Ala-D-Ala carboxypeptidase/endopeptidase (penicillin-binding protein 4)
VIPLLAVVSALLGALWTSPAQAGDAQAVRASLERAMRHAGPRASALVRDLDTGATLVSIRPDTLLVPASLEKLYTTSTALLRLGPSFRIPTAVAGDGVLEPDGTFQGDLYLKGGGDPAFGSARFIRSAYGTGASVSDLAQALANAGIERVTGRLYGDESFFDSLRGVPSSGFALTRDVGPLSALTYDHGLGKGLRFQRDPPAYAARRLAGALRSAHVRVSLTVGARRAPAEARQIAAVTSPPLATLVRLTNQPSDNFFAEMLLKGLGARFGSAGSTASGAAVVRRQMSALGLFPRVVDGSGLSRRDRTSARMAVSLLANLRGGPAGAALWSSLAVAGRNGTLKLRMRRSAARDRCRGKTGTLSNVSTLAGYCRGAGGHLLAFAILMNRVNVYGAHALQDRMLGTLARFDG